MVFTVLERRHDWWVENYALRRLAVLLNGWFSRAFVQLYSCRLISLLGISGSRQAWQVGFSLA